MPGARLERGVLLLLLAAGCGGGEAGPGPARRPSVVLISLDTVRADHLSAYGYARATSPNIDALASSGVLFEDATSTTSWTLPAHLSLLTGLEISAHGVCDDRLWQLSGAEGAPFEIPLRGTFLSELLSDAGYATAGFYTWKYLEPRFGFGPGFDVYERLGLSVYSHPEWSKRFEALRAAGAADELRAWMAASPELFDEQRPTSAEAVDAALAWLDRRAEEPFFLFLHLFDAHDDYVPPPPFDERFTDPAYAGPIDGRRVAAPDSPVRADMHPRDLAQLVALYDGEIAWVDSQVGRVLDRLEALGRRDDTLVVVTSDHGEEFFEHGGKTHRAQLFRESVHVPLVLGWPAGLPAGRRVAGPVGIVDVVPTVCALAGVGAPRGLSGRDLSGVARGAEENRSAGYVTELVVFPPGESAPLRHVGLRFDGSRVLYRHDPGRGGRWARFDLAANPDESGPGAPVAPGSEAEREVLQRVEQARARLGQARASAAPRGAAAVPLAAGELAELAHMGYASDGAAGAAGGPQGRLCLDGCVWPGQ